LQKPADPSGIASVMTLLVKVISVFGISVMGLSLLSVLVPYVLFWMARRRGTVHVRIDNAEMTRGRKTQQKIRMEIAPLLQPVMGFLFFRFLYDKDKYSPKFHLVAGSDDSRQLIRKVHKGWYHWPLPAVREYEVERLVVYFEDIFQFFSLSLPLVVKQSFFTRPKEQAIEPGSINPKKTEAENVRIEEIRRVEGEYLNYKNFENSDDVRRIVWKIYARSKELVVRIPEIMDPYASHLYLYCSYYDGLDLHDSWLVENKGINYFKNMTWTLYKTLRGRDQEVRFVPDQPIADRHLSDKDSITEYTIAACNWQTDRDLLSYVRSKDASVVCISSLVPAAQVATMLEQHGDLAALLFVKLSNALRRPPVTQWLRWLFVEDEKDEERRKRFIFQFSGHRRTMIRNEKEIEALLKKAEAKSIIV